MQTVLDLVAAADCQKAGCKPNDGTCCLCCRLSSHALFGRRATGVSGLGLRVGTLAEAPRLTDADFFVWEKRNRCYEFLTYAAEARKRPLILPPTMQLSKCTRPAHPARRVKSFTRFDR